MQKKMDLVRDIHKSVMTFLSMYTEEHNKFAQLGNVPTNRN